MNIITSFKRYIYTEQRQDNKLKVANGMFDILKVCRKSFTYVVGFSLLINLLALTVPLYMFQIFDRVLASRRYETLIYLTIIAVVALIVLGLLNIVRGGILNEVSRWLDNKLSPNVLHKSVDNLLSGDSYGHQGLKDVNTVRNFLSSSSVFYFLDMPWVPIYLFFIFWLNFTLGIIATIGAIGLFALAVINEKVSNSPIKEANNKYINNRDYIDSALTHAETLQAMGMVDNVVDKWYRNNQSILELQTKASRDSGVISSISKSIRLTLQLLILATGAYYVIRGHLSPGAMIAASIITSRALAPIEQSIAGWKVSVNAITFVTWCLGANERTCSPGWCRYL